MFVHVFRNTFNLSTLEVNILITLVTFYCAKVTINNQELYAYRITRRFLHGLADLQCVFEPASFS